MEDCDCDLGFVETSYVKVKKIYVKGSWIEKETVYDGVTFCPRCEPIRSRIQSTSTSSAELGKRLKERSPHKLIETYERDEASKTRTL